jgi:hypothetical protein
MPTFHILAHYNVLPPEFSLLPLHGRSVPPCLCFLVVESCLVASAKWEIMDDEQGEW